MDGDGKSRCSAVPGGRPPVSRQPRRSHRRVRRNTPPDPLVSDSPQFHARNSPWPTSTAKSPPSSPDRPLRKRDLRRTTPTSTSSGKYRSLARPTAAAPPHRYRDVDGDAATRFQRHHPAQPRRHHAWSIYREHPDIVAVKPILPEQGLQVYYAVESQVTRAPPVDARTGKII